MIDITRLYCDRDTPADALRYGHGRKGKQMAGAPNIPRRPRSASERRPVVVWNTSRTCNLKCVHCYTDSEAKKYEGELTTEEGKTLIEDLASFQIPALLFSGGEPLMRKDLFELAGYAASLGIRPTLSTNGTLITLETARKLKDIGFTYVGISLDGIGEVNDTFRGHEGAFKKTMQGFRNCVEVGQRVGLRLTLTRHNYRDLHNIFDFIEAENIDRACFYHLVYSGRGKDTDDLTHEESRDAMDIILARTKDFHDRGLEKDILTVDNHVDGIYLYMKLREEAPERAEAVMKLLRWNGGGMFSSGVGIGDIDFLGNVHPDQFWMHHTFGNVRERPFSVIWMDTSDPVMKGLKDRRGHIHGRCRSCKWFDACGGAMRARADLYYGDPWGPDPACYLTDEEIS
ncbi:MAG: radical SAM protein [Thermoleophilia bacterium]|nr:radical SAM protein [Thermoleophilia bacterium]